VARKAQNPSTNHFWALKGSKSMRRVWAMAGWMGSVMEIMAPSFHTLLGLKSAIVAFPPK
jgi:hypothetical protein